MSVSEHSRQIVANSLGAVAKVKGFGSKLKILSLGGCVTHVLCERFASIAEHEHLWRVTVPCFISSPVEGRNVFLAENQNVMTRLNFELSKQAVHRCTTFAPDVLALDPTSDFINDYFEKDGCVIPDLTATIFSGDGPRWDWPADFKIEEWRRITPCSFEYIELYVSALRTFVELSKENRCAILMLRRKLCLNTVAAEGLAAIDDAKLSQTNWWIDLLWNEIDAAGLSVSVLNMDERLSFTSKDAPWGEWPYHPVEEFYDYASVKMANFLRLNEKLVVNVLADIYLDRARRRRADSLLIEELRASADDLAHELDAKVAHIAGITSARDAAVSQRDQLQAMIDGLALDRDALVAKLQMAEVESKDFASRLAELTSSNETLTQVRDDLSRALRETEEAYREAGERLHQSEADRSAATQSVSALSEERDALSAAQAVHETAFGAASLERDELTARVRSLEAERDSLSLTLTSTAEMRNAALVERDTLQDALRGAQAAHETAFGAASLERDELTSLVRSLEVERDDLSRTLATTAETCNAVLAERDGLATALSEVTAERDMAVNALQSSPANSEAPADTADPSTALLHIVEAERDSLALDRARLMSVVESLSNELAVWKGQKKKSLLARIFPGGAG